MSKSKGGKVGFIAILIALVMLIVAIVGVCVSWIDSTVYASGIFGEGSSETSYSTLSDLFKTFEGQDSELAGAFKLMASFAILTVILAAATTILAGICKVLGWKLFKFILVIVAIVCVICGVVTIITTYTYCNNFNSGVDLGDLFKAGTEVAPAIGMWLTSIGGALAGLVGIFAAVKS